MKKLVITLFCMALLTMASKTQAGFQQLHHMDLELISSDPYTLHGSHDFLVPSDYNVISVGVYMPLKVTCSVGFNGKNGSNINATAGDILTTTVHWTFAIYANDSGDPVFQSTEFSSDIKHTLTNEEVAEINSHKEYSFKFDDMLGDEYNPLYVIPASDLSYIVGDDGNIYTVVVTMIASKSSIEYDTKEATTPRVGVDGIEVDGQVGIMFNTTPEPATLVLLGLAAVGGLPLARRLRRK